MITLYKHYQKKVVEKTVPFKKYELRSICVTNVPGEIQQKVIAKIHVENVSGEKVFLIPPKQL